MESPVLELELVAGPQVEPRALAVEDDLSREELLRAELREPVAVAGREVSARYRYPEERVTLG